MLEYNKEKEKVMKIAVLLELNFIKANGIFLQLQYEHCTLE